MIGIKQQQTRARLTYAFYCDRNALNMGGILQAVNGQRISNWQDNDADSGLQNTTNGQRPFFRTTQTLNPTAVFDTDDYLINSVSGQGGTWGESAKVNNLNVGTFVIRYSATLQATGQYLFSFGSAVNNNVYWRYTNRIAAGVGQLQMNNNGTTHTVTVSGGGGTATDYTIAFAFDGTNWRTYENGILRNTLAAGPIGKFTTNFTSQIAIGCNANGTGTPNGNFTGNISCVEFYDRAMTDAEALSNHNRLANRF